MNANIKFTKTDKQFQKILNSNVQAYFDLADKSKYGNHALYAKAALLFVLYAFCSIYIFFANSLFELFACYGLMGLLSVFLALNIGHEAAHNIFCKNKQLNKFLVYIFDFLGASGQIWKHKHVYSHHPHTNLFQIDLELKQPEIVRIFPQSAYIWIHRYQHLYMPFLYSIYTLIWFCYRDYKDYFELRNKLSKKQLISLTASLVIGKFLFFLRLIILPVLLTKFGCMEIIGAFVFCNLLGSITVTFALISTHVGEHSQFYEPDDHGKIQHSWIQHQFLTTSDFSTDSWWVTWLYGGFNHHLTHHLYPYISHVHYPQLTRIIKNTCDKYQMKYHSQPTIFEAIKSHFKLLRRRGLTGKNQLAWMEM